MQIAPPASTSSGSHGSCGRTLGATVLRPSLRVFPTTDSGCKSYVAETACECQATDYRRGRCSNIHSEK